MNAIARYLTDRDPVLATVIDGRPPPRYPRNRDIYVCLLESIVSQQLSVRAADTIYSRFIDLFPEQYPDPVLVLRKRPETLRKAGLSRQKAGYLRNVAAFARTGGMAYEKIHRMKDEEVIAYLTRIKGVGRWTVEMLLMFPLGRPDVLPVDDLGIQKAMATLYRLRVQGPRLKERMVRVAEAWRPYRSVACKYLWRAEIPFQERA